MVPIRINRLDRGIEVSWSDGVSKTINGDLLRMRCPCALCMELRGNMSHQKPLTGGKKLLNILSADPPKGEKNNITKVWGIGNYALGVEFADGHNTGIFTYPLLAELRDL